MLCAIPQNLVKPCYAGALERSCLPTLLSFLPQDCHTLCSHFPPRQQLTALSNLASGALDAARARLGALLADPATGLPHLATELAALAGASGDEATEAAMGRGLGRLLARSSPGFEVRFRCGLCRHGCLLPLFESAEAVMARGLGRLLAGSSPGFRGALSL